MKNIEPPTVIAIAGVTGGGKTTVTNQLIQELSHSKALYFDDYDFIGPKDIIDWVENGADYNRWDLTPLIRDLEELYNQQLDYIVLDFPFAYKHVKMRKFIDFAVFIDTPLDIALARRVTRDFKTAPAENILSDMENYISQGRKGYIEMLNTIKPNSDVIIDGTPPISEIVNLISKKVGKMRGEF
ncbi:AAA family ATPase [Salicibibacter kimchii]|uniref:Phosphoribulokinase/uridine kinase domain-containing protein n=1 Tax=Salicibibacter kimchii TaxID=2099786 RepID=A0A345BYQ6_9BACI|nr:AAA family ATPase [Salicibibacter kimchii]AXF56087.1 hypothetical protein DT065_08655 [Salicibibacter kimchii]